MVRFLLSAKSYAEIYGNAVEAAGAKATFCSEGTDETLFDALLLCGGSDVSTRRYGEARNGAKEPDEERDEAELRLLRSFTEAGKPVFGICRGEQLINVFFGGTLIQHLPTWDYHVNFQLHEVTALPDSPIGRIYGERFTVNSAHHQAINRLGKGLRDIAWSENGKIIEAVVHETLPVLAVQWHPERLALSMRTPEAPDGLDFFRYAVDAVAKGKKTFFL